MREQEVLMEAEVAAPVAPGRIAAGRIATPIGGLTVAWSKAGLREVTFDDRTVDAAAPPLPRGVVRAFEAYFAGQPDALDGLPVDARGTPFQRRVWAALRSVPPGRRLSYGALAAALGAPAAARAVGRAAATNPVALVIPCHRLVGGDGALTGFLWGIDRKRWLLAHEAAHAGGTTRAEAVGARFSRGSGRVGAGGGSRRRAG